MIGYKEEAGWVREGLEDGGVCLYAGVETCAVRKFPLKCRIDKEEREEEGREGKREGGSGGGRKEIDLRVPGINFWQES